MVNIPSAVSISLHLTGKGKMHTSPCLLECYSLLALKRIRQARKGDLPIGRRQSSLMCRHSCIPKFSSKEESIMEKQRKRTNTKKPMLLVRPVAIGSII